MIGVAGIDLDVKTLSGDYSSTTGDFLSSARSGSLGPEVDVDYCGLQDVRESTIVYEDYETVLCPDSASTFAYPAANSTPFHCAQFGGTTYTRISTRMTFDDADEYCKDSLGGSLVSIQSIDENSMVARTAYSEGSWIGFTDIISEGSWAWTLSEESNIFRSWQLGEPNNADGEEHCAMIIPSGKGSNWYDNKCNVEASFVCQTECGSTGCGDFDPRCFTAEGFVLDSSQGSGRNTRLITIIGAVLGGAALIALISTTVFCRKKYEDDDLPEYNYRRS